jgi:hypothetical protein
MWYYDTMDLTPFLQQGENKMSFVVLRYFASNRAAIPFERTALPGLTVVGLVEAGNTIVNLSSENDWLARVDEGITFPTGLVDDWCLHVSDITSCK